MDAVYVIAERKAERALERTLERVAERVLGRAEPKDRRPVHPEGFDWLTLRRVAELTGWSKATLARRRADGSLPYSLVGTTVFVHVDDLRALMERNRTTPRAGGDGAAVGTPQIPRATDAR